MSEMHCLIKTLENMQYKKMSHTPILCVCGGVSIASGNILDIYMTRRELVYVIRFLLRNKNWMSELVRKKTIVSLQKQLSKHYRR